MSPPVRDPVRRRPDGARRTGGPGGVLQVGRAAPRPRRDVRPPHARQSQRRRGCGAGGVFARMGRRGGLARRLALHDLAPSRGRERVSRSSVERQKMREVSTAGPGSSPRSPSSSTRGPIRASSAHAADVARHVQDALAALPPTQRLAVTLCHCEGQSNIEAAAIMEISVEALESLLARGRRAMRARLRPMARGADREGTMSDARSRWPSSTAARRARHRCANAGPRTHGRRRRALVARSAEARAAMGRGGGARSHARRVAADGAVAAIWSSACSPTGPSPRVPARWRHAAAASRAARRGGRARALARERPERAGARAAGGRPHLGRSRRVREPDRLSLGFLRRRRVGERAVARLRRLDARLPQSRRRTDTEARSTV